MKKYAKAIVALVGLVATAVLTTVPPDTTEWKVASTVVAVLTAFGVYRVPNAAD